MIDPVTALPFAKVSRIEHGHLIEALRTAELAFVQWRNRPAAERGAILHRVADLPLSRRPEVARAITMENGKPLGKVRAK